MSSTVFLKMNSTNQVYGNLEIAGTLSKVVSYYFNNDKNNIDYVVKIERRVGLDGLKEWRRFPYRKYWEIDRVKRDWDKDWHGLYIHKQDKANYKHWKTERRIYDIEWKTQFLEWVIECSHLDQKEWRESY